MNVLSSSTLLAGCSSASSAPRSNANTAGESRNPVAKGRAGLTAGRKGCGHSRCCWQPGVDFLLRAFPPLVLNHVCLALLGA